MLRQLELCSGTLWSDWWTTKLFVVILKKKSQHDFNVYQLYVLCCGWKIYFPVSPPPSHANQPNKHILNAVSTVVLYVHQTRHNVRSRTNAQYVYIIVKFIFAQDFVASRLAADRLAYSDFMNFILVIVVSLSVHLTSTVRPLSKVEIACSPAEWFAVNQHIVFFGGIVIVH